MFCRLLLVFLGSALAVDRSNFKTCEQSGFCKRNRAMQPGSSRYEVVQGSVQSTGSGMTFGLVNVDSQVQLKAELTVLEMEAIRLRVVEAAPIRERWEIPIGDVLIQEPQKRSTSVAEADDGAVLTWNSYKVVVKSKPFQVDVLFEGRPLMSVNARGLMKFEHYRTKQQKEEKETGEDQAPDKQESDEEQPAEEGAKESEAAEEPDMWEETFKTHTDTKPFGPSSVGVDVSLPGAEHVYGIPEHADTLALKTTSSGDPYRLYNLDVFEYELWNPMALYGSVPLMYAHSQLSTVGIFWYNPSETWVDIASNSADKGLFRSVMGMFSSNDEIPQVDTHWMSESGNLDMFLLLGPRPADVAQQYARLTGTTQLPPLFSIAYHQCRWNYNDQDDVKSVDENFDKHDIPMDVIWLDIEHTDGKRYFTWDSNKFPDSVAMVNGLAAKGRKMVTIVDPHIKQDDNYPVYKEAKDLGYYVKDKHNNDYDGWCWPGTSRWLDFLQPQIRQYWADRFALDKYTGTTNDVHTWNDMNEPSVFNGPEITMHKDALHLNGREHREVHNVYGLYQQRATAEGLIQRSGGKLRPFVLSRAIFAGSQRWGAIWTGDNTGEWEHLRVSVPMLLSLSISGITFCGADVGGFFKNPDAELLTRWYQAGAYQPFFRAHAHLDTKRREPYLLEAQYVDSIRASIRARYSLLPFWYTQFYNSEQSGAPIMQPLWFVFPKDKKTFDMDTQYMLGSSLLVRPITEQGHTSADVYLPGESEVWYDIEGYRSYLGQQHIRMDADLNKIPVLQRGGSIIPRKYRVRRSSALMRDDPYTLVVCLDRQNEARGELYLDDYESFDYKHSQAYLMLEFTFTNNKLHNRVTHSSANFATKAWLERVIVVGVTTQPTAVNFVNAKGATAPVDFLFEDNILLVRKAAEHLDEEWELQIVY